MTQQPKDLEALLISKAMADEAFKNELISNPKAVIAREIGQELPEDLEIEVLESTQKKLYLVLPLKVGAEGNYTDELPDKELDAVAGGSAVSDLLTATLISGARSIITNVVTHGNSPWCDPGERY
jgi:hypothetical protein